MERLLVGGAVRDTLLQRSPKDQDWLVLGITPEALVARGFRPVGRSFTVFLAPGSNEEHALPRGVPTGTSGNNNADLTTDLQRRDLTINAMAMRADGTVIDPFNGQADLAAQILRHVDTHHFADDPIRVMRTARFAARLGFAIAPETVTLMRDICASGKLLAAAPERIFNELMAGIATGQPRNYLGALRRCGALAVILPEVERLFGVPQPPEHHPEVDTGEHIMLTLESAQAKNASPPAIYAALLHDVGKGLTPVQEWPRHTRHEQTGVPLVEAISERLVMPNDYRRTAILVTGQHLRCHVALSARPGKVYALLHAVSAFSQRSLLEPVLEACLADAQGRLGRFDTPYPQAAWLRHAASAAATVTAQPFVDKGLQGPAIADAMGQARIRAIAKAKQTFGPSNE